jgi:hypothetical protein
MSKHTKMDLKGLLIRGITVKMEGVLRGFQQTMDSQVHQHNNIVEGFSLGFFSVIMALAAVSVYYKNGFINIKEKFKNYEETDLV